MTRVVQTPQPTKSMMIISVTVTLVCTIALTLLSSIQPSHASHVDAGITTLGGLGSRSWRRLIEAEIGAYELITPGVTISTQALAQDYEPPALTKTASQITRNWLMANTIDFALCDSTHNPQDALTSPDLYAMPYAAQNMVIGYNIPGLTATLILSMEVTARIFLGNITKWNDVAITALNPGATLPNQNITLVVRGDLIALNIVFNTAMGGAYPPWTWPGGVTSPATGLLTFPYKANLVTRNNFFSHGTAMSTIPYAIGYLWQDEANNLGVSYASFKTPKGAIIAPTSDSLLFNVMEKGGVPFVQGVLSVGDLTNPTGPSAWPIAGWSFLIIHTSVFRQTCAIKNAMLKFWLWFYTSSTAAKIATAFGFVIPPAQILASLNIVNVINSGVFCSGDLALPAERTEESLGIGSGIASDILGLYPAVYNSLSTTTGTITFSETDSDDALQRLLWGEVDFAVTVASIMRVDKLTEALNSGDIVQLPLFAVTFAQIYNLPTTLGQPTIILDFETMSNIWMGRITKWNDDAIGMLNPQLRASGLLPNLSITRVVADTGEREAERLFFYSLAIHTMDSTDSAYNISYDKYGVPDHLTDTPWFIEQMNAGQPIITVSSEHKVQAAVNNLPGAIGMSIVTSNLESTTTRSRVLRPDGSIVSPTSKATYQCMGDTFNATSFQFKTSLSTTPGCWPFSTFLYSVVRTANVDNECLNAPRALQFLQFLHDQTSTNAEATESTTSLSTDEAVTAAAAALARTSLVAENLGALWAPPSKRAIAQAKLKEVTCDGETILVTLPVDHKLTIEVQSAMMGLSILGVILVALILCFIYFFHLRSTIKASSPIFLIATIIGVLMLFISGSLLARTDPTNDTCQSGWWILNLGFLMTFGPLFAKTWRIYKIFMRKEMTVIRLTDMSLFTRLAILLAFDMMMLGIMQSVAPVRAIVAVQSALPRDQTIYYCAPTNVGFASAIGSYKGLLLLFGAMMSFSTRTVSENFNESKPIALAIYNVLFTMCIIIPIALLTQSDGRTLYILTIAAIYWITLCTLVIIFAPKVITIYKDASGLFAQRISDSKASASEIASRNPGGRTIKELAQQPVRLMDRTTLRTYVILLEREIALARAALATLDANEGVLAGGGHHNGGGGGAYPLMGGQRNQSGSRVGDSGAVTMASVNTPTGRTSQQPRGFAVSSGSPKTGPVTSTSRNNSGGDRAGTSSGSNQFKYTGPTINVRGVASVAPMPSPSKSKSQSQGSTGSGGASAQTNPLLGFLTAGSTTSNMGAASSGWTNGNTGGSGGNQSRTATPGIEMKVPLSPSSTGRTMTAADDESSFISRTGLSSIHTTQTAGVSSSSAPKTRFEMPNTANNNASSSSSSSTGASSSSNPAGATASPPTRGRSGLATSSQQGAALTINSHAEPASDAPSRPLTGDPANRSLGSIHIRGIGHTTTSTASTAPTAGVAAYLSSASVDDNGPPS